MINRKMTSQICLVLEKTITTCHQISMIRRRQVRTLKLYRNSKMIRIQLISQLLQALRKSWKFRYLKTQMKLSNKRIKK
jgi:hypothetical protein